MRDHKNRLPEGSRLTAYQLTITHTAAATAMLENLYPPHIPKKILRQMASMDMTHANKRFMVGSGWCSTTLAEEYRTEDGLQLSARQIQNIINRKSGTAHYSDLIQYITNNPGPGLTQGKNTRKGPKNG